MAPREERAYLKLTAMSVRGTRRVSPPFAWTRANPDRGYKCASPLSHEPALRSRCHESTADAHERTLLALTMAARVIALPWLE